MIDWIKAIAFAPRLTLLQFVRVWMSAIFRLTKADHSCFSVVFLFCSFLYPVSWIPTKGNYVSFILKSSAEGNYVWFIDGPKYNEIRRRQISGESWTQSVNHLYFRKNPIDGQSVTRNSSATNFIVFRTLYQLLLIWLKWIARWFNDLVIRQLQQICSSTTVV